MVKHTIKLQIKENHITIYMVDLMFISYAQCPTQWKCELTPYSQRPHLNYLTVASFWGHSVSSQWTHKTSSHCVLSVSLQLTPWACSELFVISSQWAHHAVAALWVGLLLDHCVSSLWSLTVYLTVRYSGWAHCDHGVSSQLHWEALF